MTWAAFMTLGLQSLTDDIDWAPLWARATGGWW